jgi:hypothetical protein
MRRATPPGFRELWRTATVVLLLVPVSQLGGGTSTAGRLVAVAALAPVTAMLVAMGVLPLRQSYLWIVLFSGLLLLSFAFPQVTTSLTMRSGPHRIVDFLATFHGLTPAQLSRLSDLVGLLAGLALMGVSVASSPHPRQVARVTVLSGMVTDGGLLYVSVYNDQGFQSRLWWHVKRRFNRSGLLMRQVLLAGSAAYLARHVPLRKLVRVGRPEAFVPDRRPRARGMSVRHDLVDWAAGSRSRWPSPRVCSSSYGRAASSCATSRSEEAASAVTSTSSNAVGGSDERSPSTTVSVLALADDRRLCRTPGPSAFAFE